MKRLIKKCVAVIFAIMMCANVFAYDFQVDGVYYNINSGTTTVRVTYENTNYNSYSGSVVIPSTVTYNGTTYSVTSIGEWAFYGCSGLTSITIPNSITSIGVWAFGDCTNLTSITIPNSVTSISGMTFYNCTSLTSITIPNNVTSISGMTFYNCTSLTSITIPNSVTSIGSSAFSNCTSLTSVTIPESVTIIEYDAFSNCTSLTSITIPNNVTSIGNYAFTICTSLTSVTIGNSVTSIGEGAFADCNNIAILNYNAKNCTTVNGAFLNKTSITTLTIGDSVEYIGDKAFYKCTGLNTIDCKAENPPVLGTTVFGSINKDNVTLIVPCEKSSLYQNATGWSLFNNIVEDCESSIDVVEENQILVYPNPAKDNITLEADEDIFIFNNLGQIVKQVNNPKGKIIISVADLPKGTYYLKAGEKKQKLIINN